MIVGHYAAALVPYSRLEGRPLWLLLLCANVPEFLWLVLALAVILLQPGFGTRAAPSQVADLEVLVVVDRTRSMAALDHQGGPRVYGVQQDLADLAEALPGARFAMLTFGADVELELPFTSDTTTFGTAAAASVSA